jgi:hypothetical protein
MDKLIGSLYNYIGLFLQFMHIYTMIFYAKFFLFNRTNFQVIFKLFSVKNLSKIFRYSEFSKYFFLFKFSKNQSINFYLLILIDPLLYANMRLFFKLSCSRVVRE